MSSPDPWSRQFRRAIAPDRLETALLRVFPSGGQSVARRNAHAALAEARTLAEARERAAELLSGRRDQSRARGL